MNNYTVQKGDTLYGISKRFNTSVESIKKLNNLNSNTITPGQVLRVTSNNESNPLECIVYTVKKGDSLYSISKKYNTTVDEIKKYNNLTSNLLNIGDRIIIPCNVENDYKNLNNNYVDYVVVKGDTLYSIAKKFNTSVDKIIELNDLKNNNLSIGQKLIVDDRSGVSSVLECFGDNNIDVQKYTVKKGESLYSIAKKFNTSVDSLKRKNNLSSNLINVGQELII